MKLLWLMLLVMLTEYTFGADLNDARDKLNGGIEMKLNIMRFDVIPDKLGSANTNMVTELTADDMVETISALDDRYDYKIYREFDKQYIVIASPKGQSDTMAGMQYMTYNNIKSWYSDKLDEVLGLNKEEI